MSVSQQAAELLAWIDQRAQPVEGRVLLPRSSWDYCAKAVGRICRDHWEEMTPYERDGMKQLREIFSVGNFSQSICDDWSYPPMNVSSAHMVLRLIAALPTVAGTGETIILDDTEGPILDDTDVAILRYLSESPTVAKSQEDIAAGAKFDRKTVADRLDRLRAAGYVSRPKGKKQKDAITKAGIERLGLIDAAL